MKRGYLNLKGLAVTGKGERWGRPTVLIMTSLDGTGRSGGIRETCASSDYYDSI